MPYKITLMEQSPIYIHVGLMKTATTTLQTRVFPAHDDVYYLGGPEYINNDVRISVAAISKQDRLLFDAKSHNDNIRSTLDYARTQGKSILLSAESLSTPTVDRLTKAERLVEVFGDIRIIICLRHPIDLMTSLYGEAIKQLYPRTQRMPSIDEWLSQEWSDQRATRAARFLDFSRLIHAYYDLLGENNVCAMLFEELRNNPEFFAGKLSEFIGINSTRTHFLLRGREENKRLNQLDYLLFKHSNIFGNNEIKNSIRRLIPAPVKTLVKKSMSGTRQFEMSDLWKKTIMDYSHEVN